jgi:hypothetical protein
MVKYHFIEKILGPYYSQKDGGRYVTVVLRNLEDLECVITYVGPRYKNFAFWQQPLTDFVEHKGVVIRGLTEKLRKDLTVYRNKDDLKILSADHGEVELTVSYTDVVECVNLKHNNAYLKIADWPNG